MFDWQAAFNIAIGFGGAMGGWFLKSVGDAISDLRNKDAALGAELHQVHLLVADNYVKRDEFKSSLDAMFESLRRIEDKLMHKQDK